MYTIGVAYLHQGEIEGGQSVFLGCDLHGRSKRGGVYGYERIARAE